MTDNPQVSEERLLSLRKQYLHRAHGESRDENDNVAQELADVANAIDELLRLRTDKGDAAGMTQSARYKISQLRAKALELYDEIDAALSTPREPQAEQPPNCGRCGQPMQPWGENGEWECHSTQPAAPTATVAQPGDEGLCEKLASIRDAIKDECATNYRRQEVIDLEVSALNEAIAALSVEAREAQDAARYRWLRKHDVSYKDDPVATDAYIDAAIAARGKTE